MEKQNPNIEQQEIGDVIIAKARANKEVLVWCLAGVFILAIGVLIWLMVAQSGSRKADELIAKADAAQTDSVALALYADAAKAGYKSGNRAKAELGIRYYRDGKYEDALKYLDDCSLDDNIAAAGVYTLRGDCHVNLDQLDEALACYKKAVSKADKNPEIVPFVLIKEANIYRAQKNYADEAKCYKTILDEYPTYVASTRTDLEKYYQRALAAE